MTHVLIATPTGGVVVKALYATTLVKTIVAVKEAGWGVDFLTVDGSYISKALKPGTTSPTSSCVSRTSRTW